MDKEADELVAALARVEWSPAADAEPAKAWSNLRQLAEIEASDPLAARAVSLLAGVIGMMLNGLDWDRPYSPLMQFDDRRTHVPSDFTPTELLFFERLLPMVSPNQLSARMADVLHIRSTEKSDRFRWAKDAVDRWIAAGFSRDLSRSEQEDWKRAADVAARFHMDAAKQALIDLGLRTFHAGDAATAWSMARAMRAARYFPDPDLVAERLESLGLETGDGHFQRQLYEESIQWTRGVGEQARSTRQTLLGDSWWREAESRRSDSRMVARDFFGNSFNAYRAIPSRHRTQHVVDRLTALPEIIRVEGDAALSEMMPLEGEPIDLSNIAESARRIAQMDNVLDALAAWLDNVRMDDFATAREEARKQMAAHPLLHVFSRTTVDSDGRTIHRSDGTRERMGVPDDEWSEMIRSFELKSSLLSSGYIWPALREFSSRQRFTLADFDIIVSASPFVPAEVRGLYARGLFHGYYERFAEAIHLLAPATEACVRGVLQRGGVETRTIRQDDTEIEPGLSALIDLPGADEVLGVDLAWNIRALYCGPLGPNLRNRVAHGLLSSDEASGIHMLGAWWLAFRLAYVPYYNAVQLDGTPPTPSTAGNGTSDASNTSTSD
ncbi:DUF4209 domain-containing protein [Microbacterium sp. NPDC056057]|uniref:DUF4209 domain-containing protein n=1 Tax=Microbacterium sp. NPDC056057 TaxID=3345699 RepID=UPI0035E3A091